MKFKIFRSKESSLYNLANLCDIRELMEEKSYKQYINNLFIGNVDRLYFHKEVLRFTVIHDKVSDSLRGWVFIRDNGMNIVSEDCEFESTKQFTSIKNKFWKKYGGYIEYGSIDLIVMISKNK